MKNQVTCEKHTSNWNYFITEYLKTASPLASYPFLGTLACAVDDLPTSVRGNSRLGPVHCSALLIYRTAGRTMRALLAFLF